MTLVNLMFFCELSDSGEPGDSGEYIDIGDSCETGNGRLQNKTSQELRMLSSVTLDCQVTKIVMNSDSQL